MPSVTRGSTRTAELPGGSPPEDDAVLVVRAQADRQAFDALYVRYVERVYRYCYRRLGEPEAAADATSQIFAKAMVALPGCRAASFRSWLFAIAHNVLADTFRACRPEPPLEAAAEIVDPAPSPEAAAVVADERRWVVTLLAHLTPDQRQVVELRLAGLTATEIGAVLGRNRGAIDVAHNRAVNRLRVLLGVGAAAKEGHDVGR